MSILFFLLLLSFTTFCLSQPLCRSAGIFPALLMAFFFPSQTLVLAAIVAVSVAYSQRRKINELLQHIRSLHDR